MTMVYTGWVTVVALYKLCYTNYVHVCHSQSFLTLVLKARHISDCLLGGPLSLYAQKECPLSPMACSGIPKRQSLTCLALRTKVRKNYNDCGIHWVSDCSCTVQTVLCAEIWCSYTCVLILSHYVHTTVSVGMPYILSHSVHTTVSVEMPSPLSLCTHYSQYRNAISSLTLCTLQPV